MTWCQGSPSTMNHLPPEHRCGRCKKPRSRSYRESHPLRPGHDRPMGICSRPHCTRPPPEESKEPRSATVLVVHEVHHYYHATPPPEKTHQPSSDKERNHAYTRTSRQPEIPAVAELPADRPEIPKERASRVNQPLMPTSPQVRYDRKPIFTRKPSRDRTG
jgi:hypothetical protein